MTALSDWFHEATDIPADGLKCQRQASPAQCAELADLLEVTAVERLKTKYEIQSLSAGRYRFKGTFVATYTQQCGVTLESIEQHCEERIDEEFHPELTIPKTSEDAEGEVLSQGNVEPIENGCLQTGRVIYELFAATVDPHPRKQGVHLDWQDPETGTGEGATSPFAALAKLKDGS